MLDTPTRRLLPWLAAVAFFMQTLDATILNTALPSMARSLGESPLRMQSVVVAYMLTTALLIPASGWLADRFGTRRVFLSAIGLFSLGSLFCALAPTLPVLVAGREAVNGLFEYRLVLQTPDEVAEFGGLLRGANFSLPDMVGREISCAIELEGHGSGLLGNKGAGERQINALITEARLLGEDSRHALYELTLRPWL